jgi:hypothetical protein
MKSLSGGPEAGAYMHSETTDQSMRLCFLVALLITGSFLLCHASELVPNWSASSIAFGSFYVCV